MTPSTENELEVQLEEAGNKLLDPPQSVEELLPLLDNVESCLSRVEQSPPDSMQNALAPSLKALVSEQLFRHSNIDVRVAVASCISEITRITAPDAPYSDDQMKDVFQLIVSTFKDLADNSSRSYVKRTMILETVANVRSCVVMLDLECDALIIEMFEHFLNSVRDYHSDTVFNSMRIIMSLVLEESEDISVELLTPLLVCVKKSNKNILPVAQKLGEKVIEKCAPKIIPYLAKAFISLGIVADDCSPVVASACASILNSTSNVENNDLDEKASNHDEHIRSENEHTSKSSKGGDEEEKGIRSNTDLPSKTSSDPVVYTGSQISDAGQVVGPKKRGRKPKVLKTQLTFSGSNNVASDRNENQDSKPDLKVASSSRIKDSSDAGALPLKKKKKDTDTDVSVSKDVENDSKIVAVCENQPTEKKKLGRPRKKIRTPKGNNLSKSVPEKVSTEDSRTDTDTPKHSGLKESSSKETSKSDKNASKKSEEKTVKQAKRKIEGSSTNGVKSNIKLEEDEKRQSHAKGVSNLDKKAESKSKEAHSMNATPETALRRKKTQQSSTKEYGHEVVGSKVKVWWPQDRQFYEGTIESFNSTKKRHTVVYVDGDVEILNLEKQKFEFIRNDTESSKEAPDNQKQNTASELPLKKKLKTTHSQSRKPDKGDTSKEDIGQSTAKSKSGNATKHGQKSRDVSKTDGKVLDDGKESKKDIDVGEKIKEHTPKSVALPKGSSKQKTDDKLSKVSKSIDDSKLSKFKHETPKSALSSKSKPSVNDGKHKRNDEDEVDEEDENEDEDDAAVDDDDVDADDDDDVGDEVDDDGNEGNTTDSVIPERDDSGKQSNKKKRKA